MNVMQIIQLVVLVFSLLKQMEGKEPSGDAVKDTITDIAQMFGKTEIVEAVATIPGEMFLALGKLFASE